jgi:molybdopterin converting factor subunit 1
MLAMKIRVRLFAMLRERAGSDWLELELEDQATVAEALAQIRHEGVLGELAERLPLRMAVNREYADDATPLSPGDELALVPPVSGGALPHARVSAEPLSADALSRAVADPAAGAVVCFKGVTREVPRLDYEAYAEMAEERIREILAEATERHGLCAAAAEHRVGEVPLGEPAVVVAVAAPHREEAFAGAREAIDRIKAEAPIWKRETGADGRAEWVEGAAPRDAEAAR